MYELHFDLLALSILYHDLHTLYFLKDICVDPHFKSVKSTGRSLRGFADSNL